VSYSKKQIEEENASCGCACHGMAKIAENFCTACREHHGKYLRGILGELQADYKKLNEEFVHAHTASASLKTKIHDLLAWVRDSSGSKDHPPHEPKNPASGCAFCTTGREILEVIKTNKIGDNIIRMLRQRNEILKIFTALEKAKELRCYMHDDDKPLMPCICEEIESARLDVQESFENLVQMIRDTKLDEER